MFLSQINYVNSKIFPNFATIYSWTFILQDEKVFFSVFLTAVLLCLIRRAEEVSCLCRGFLQP